MKIVKILSSSNRRKIVQTLHKTQQINIMSLVDKTRSTYNQVQSDIQLLKKEEIIIEERVGRSRIIKLNKENPKTELLLKALKTINELQKEANNKKQSQHMTT